MGRDRIELCDGDMERWCGRTGYSYNYVMETVKGGMEGQDIVIII